jgi:hypothetical protein
VLEKEPGEWAGVASWFHGISPYLSTVFLACWGGAVSYISRIRKGKCKVNWRELFFDLVVSSFAGVLTHLLCESVGIEGAKAAMLIAVSGHMGTRAIAGFEHLRDRIFGISGDK